MPYKNDIFISYWRDPETLRWIDAHFLPLLRHHVGYELCRRPDIYVHEIQGQIPAGVAWPMELGEELGSSRTLIALWSKPYLSSAWCTEELSIMLAREQESGARTLGNKYGLVVPVIAHDGETIPSELGLTQRMDIKAYCNPRMRSDSEKAEALSDYIGRHAEGLAMAIEAAPSWREEWPRAAAQRLYRRYFSSQQPSQRRAPRFQG